MNDVIVLRSGEARAVVRPAEGLGAAELHIGGASVLARTPWADQVSAEAEPAGDEEAWVARWRGGWQLCFPSAGQPDPAAAPPEGFHGRASQTPWSVRRVERSRVEGEWQDGAGLVARRRWTVHPDGLEAETLARNDGTASRRLALAEHLILGADILAPIVSEAGTLVLQADGVLAELDYAGMPTGRRSPWPGDDWDRLHSLTPARVAALEGSTRRVVHVIGPALTAVVSWDGLDHALLWEEVGRTAEPPWNGVVHALGVEPTSTPHGAGTGLPDGAITLAPGGELSWRVGLRVRPTRSMDGGRNDP